MTHDLMTDGDEWIVFTRNTRLLSRIIRFFTGSWSSHAAYIRVLPKWWKAHGKVLEDLLIEK